MTSNGACQLDEKPQLRAGCPVSPLKEFLSGNVDLATIEDRSEALLYGSGVEARRVRRDGMIKWAGGYLFIGEAMAHEIVGMKRVDDDRWYVHLGSMRLGVLHERSRTVVPLAEDEIQPSVTHVPGHASSYPLQRDSEVG